MPSYLDSWGRVVLEAMACGTPVIVTENTGVKDAVGANGGRVIPVGDLSQLKEGIFHFYHHRSEVESMGKQARKNAEKYTWEGYRNQVVTKVREIYQERTRP